MTISREENFFKYVESVLAHDFKEFKVDFTVENTNVIRIWSIDTGINVMHRTMSFQTIHEFYWYLQGIWTMVKNLEVSNV